ELRRPVTVPRKNCSLGRMNDDRTDLEVFQQCRDLVFGDWTSATIFVPLRVWRAASRGCRIPLPSRKTSRRWLHGCRSCATHTRLDAAAQQAQADEERAVKKCPVGGTRRRQK